MLVEIHTHSTVSDGVLSPPALARACSEAGVALWSLTDHDTIAGAREARAAADEAQVEFVCGVELSAQYEGESVHVLGYGVREDSETLAAALAAAGRRRSSRMEEMVERAQARGFRVTMEQVRAGTPSEVNLARPHLARALVRLGYVQDVPEAFARYLGQGRSLYIPSARLSVEESIALIVEAGGFAVLAHPARYGLDRRIEAWREAGLAGIEVAHPSHDEAARARYASIARRLNLLATSSSDFHAPRPGAALGQIEWGPAELEAFRAALAG